MPSVFGHSAVGYTLAKLLDSKNSKWLLLAAIFSTNLPDFDVLAFKFGIPYEHPFGHRGFTHSVIFAFIWAVILMFAFGKNRKMLWFLVVFVGTLSHGIFDAMTSGGRGVGFFIPIDNSRYFFPFRDIKVSPIGVDRFFSAWGIKVLFSEIKYIIFPCFLILAVRFLFLKLKRMEKR
ncbi:metal-dependent hydrolase [Flavisericum labens]|uniref:metal-dependent hydrolase n=1 Tax=Flavisericum labens TaxID=3377112 RepID=UPI00387AF3D2